MGSEEAIQISVKDGDLEEKTTYSLIGKRIGNLKNLYDSKTCIEPKIFPCPVLWYTPVQTGLTRKDKLEDHSENSTKWSPSPAIQPKPPRQSLVRKARPSDQRPVTPPESDTETR